MVLLNLITDRWQPYNETITILLLNAMHILAKTMYSDINNKLTESFNKTFKDCYKSKSSLFISANRLIYLINLQNYYLLHTYLPYNKLFKLI